jgi:hypothetical protein
MTKSHASAAPKPPRPVSAWGRRPAPPGHVRRRGSQVQRGSLALVFAVACAAEPKRPGVSDTGASLREIGDALVGVWRSEAPPSGGSWTDEGCRLTEWIECDLVEFVIDGWTEQVPQQHLHVYGPPFDDAEFLGSSFRKRCAVEWIQGEVAEVSRRGTYGSWADLYLEGDAVVLTFGGFFPSNPNAQPSQDIVCERSSSDQLDCGWSPYSELGAGVDRTDRLVLERVDAADEPLLCDELFERYLLSPRSTAPWNER